MNMEKIKKEFKIGEKLYLSFEDSSVEGYTIIDKEDKYYIEDGNHRVYYEMLHLQPDNKDLADGYIEDYNAIEEGLSEDDSRVVKYKEQFKETKVVSLEDACKYIEGLIDFLNENGHQFKTKFIVDNFRRAMEEKCYSLTLFNLNNLDN